MYLTILVLLYDLIAGFSQNRKLLRDQKMEENRPCAPVFTFLDYLNR